jgi:mannan endo-1,4-beta-mannosidase
MRAGDVSYVGDPPHEPQGWYSVFDADQSTIALISAHASALRDQGRR